MDTAGRKFGTLAKKTLEGLLPERRTSVGLQMTPMIDVIFLLLTFFVITARFRRPEAFLPITLPSANSIQSVRAQIVEPLILEVSEHTSGCLIQIGAEEKIALSEASPQEGLAAMADALSRIYKVQGRIAEDPIELILHDEVSWDFVVKIYDMLTAMGAAHISFVMTEQMDESR